MPRSDVQHAEIRCAARRADAEIRCAARRDQIDAVRALTSGIQIVGRFSLIECSSCIPRARAGARRGWRGHAKGLSNHPRRAHTSILRQKQHYFLLQAGLQQKVGRIQNALFLTTSATQSTHTRMNDYSGSWLFWVRGVCVCWGCAALFEPAERVLPFCQVEVQQRRHAPSWCCHHQPAQKRERQV